MRVYGPTVVYSISSFCIFQHSTFSFTRSILRVRWERTVAVDRGMSVDCGIMHYNAHEMSNVVAIVDNEMLLTLHFDIIQMNRNAYDCLWVRGVACVCELSVWQNCQYISLFNAQAVDSKTWCTWFEFAQFRTENGQQQQQKKEKKSRNTELTFAKSMCVWVYSVHEHTWHKTSEEKCRCAVELKLHFLRNRKREIEFSISRSERQSKRHQRTIVLQDFV